MSEETETAMRPSLLMAIAVGIFVVVAAAAPVSHIAIDQLPRPAARTAAADKIAMALADKDAEFRRAAANCRAEADPRGFEYRVGARRLLESSTLYSVEIAASWYCGGAYPDRNATALTFDLQNGSPYDLNRIFHVGSSHLSSQEPSTARPPLLGGLGLRLHPLNEVVEVMRPNQKEVGFLC